MPYRSMDWPAISRSRGLRVLLSLLRYHNLPGDALVLWFFCLSVLLHIAANIQWMHIGKTSVNFLKLIKQWFQGPETKHNNTTPVFLLMACGKKVPSCSCLLDCFVMSCNLVLLGGAPGVVHAQCAHSVPNWPSRHHLLSQFWDTILMYLPTSTQ